MSSKPIPGRAPTRAPKRLIAGLLSCAAWACCAPALWAFDAVDLNLRGGPAEPEAREAFTESLRDASLLVTLIDNADSTPRDVVAAARSDYTTLVEALFSRGHYSTVVSIRLNGREASAISPLGVPDRIETVEIVVDPGPQFTFGTTSIQPLAPDTVLPDGFARGQPARAALVRQATRTAVQAWRERGHPKVEISGQDVTARHSASELDVGVSLTPGPRLRFGDSPVSGQTRVSAPRIRQIAGLPRGEIYSPEAVEDAARRLRRAGTFRSVRLIEGPPLPDGTLDIDIVVVDREPRRIGAGAEVSSSDGLKLTGYWLHRNILGGAESLRFDAEIRQLAGVDSGTDYILSARFERPAVFGPDTRFFTEAEIARYDEPDFLISGGRLEAGFSQEVTDTLTIEAGLGLSYREVTDRFLEDEPTRELFYVSVPGKATLDERDDTLDATEGYYVEIAAEPFIETLQEDRGIHLDLDGRVYRAFGEGARVVLAGRVQLGSLIGVEPEAAPPEGLFYSGGGDTVRGQPYQSLNIIYGDNTLGGRSFAGFSAEVRFDATASLGGVVFADFGLLSGESDWSDPVDHAGAGLGVRYNTPIGPIRFDIAVPISEGSGFGDDPVQYYIGIGQAF